MRKIILVAFLAVVFSGCSAIRDFGWQRHSWDGGDIGQQTQDDIRKMAIRQHNMGFKEGVRKNVDTTIRQHGNTAPYIGWEYPIYQDVTIPSEVRGGALYLRHVEPVMMQPGAYRMYHAQPFSPEVRHQYAEPKLPVHPSRKSKSSRPDYRNRYTRTLIPASNYGGQKRYRDGFVQASYNPDRYSNRYWGK